jgi:hypothetical protein
MSLGEDAETAFRESLPEGKKFGVGTTWKIEVCALAKQAPATQSNEKLSFISTLELMDTGASASFITCTRVVKFAIAAQICINR